MRQTKKFVPAVVFVLVCIIIGSTFVHAQTAAISPTAFRITAEGTAIYKTSTIVGITMDFTGLATDDSLHYILMIEGGEVTAGALGKQVTFVSQGFAVLLKNYQYMYMYLIVKNQYGNQKTIWVFNGQYQKLSNKVKIEFWTVEVYLPTDTSFVKLQNLILDGQITAT
jgi:hypothetical protein